MVLFYLNAYNLTFEQKIQHRALNHASGCLVNSLLFKQTVEAYAKLQEKEVNTAIIIFTYRLFDTQYGHAVCVYLIDGHLWVYDPALGSYPTFLVAEDQIYIRCTGIIETMEVLTTNN